MTASKIITDLAVDDALDMGAGYQFDAADRRYIDNQALGCERHLVDSLISGTIATWMLLDPGCSGGSAGDVVCLASSATAKSIKLATDANLATAKGPVGIQLENGVAGARVRVAIAGVVPAAITGLASGSAGFARINTSTGAVERVADYATADYSLGAVDDAGNLALSIGLPVDVTPGIGTNRWTQLAAFTATPPTTSTITITDSDLLDSIKVGTPIKWLGSVGSAATGGRITFGDTGGIIASEAITGIASSNITTSGTLLIVCVDDGDPYYHLELYDNPALDSSHLVAHTATFDDTAGPTAALVEDNSSGLGGTITIGAGACSSITMALVCMWAGIVDSITGTTITVAGRPLDTSSGSIAELWYGDPSLVHKRTWRIDGVSGVGAPLTSVSDTLLDNQCDAPLNIDQAYAHLVRFRAYAYDNGAGSGKINAIKGGTKYVSSNDSSNGLNLAAAKTWYQTTIDINAEAVPIAPDDDIEISCTATDSGVEHITAELLYVVL